jgi:hypothetical protein
MRRQGFSTTYSCYIILERPQFELRQQENNNQEFTYNAAGYQSLFPRVVFQGQSGAEIRNQTNR